MFKLDVRSWESNPTALANHCDYHDRRPDSMSHSNGVLWERVGWASSQHLHSPTATLGRATPFTPTFRSARSSDDKTVSSRSSSTSSWGERNHRATRTITRDTAGPYFIQETLPPPSMAGLASGRRAPELRSAACGQASAPPPSHPPLLAGKDVFVRSCTSGIAREVGRRATLVLCMWGEKSNANVWYYRIFQAAFFSFGFWFRKPPSSTRLRCFSAGRRRCCKRAATSCRE